MNKIHPDQKILTEGYFFTSEQLNEYTQKIIKQALETAAEKGRANGYWYNGEFIHNFPKSAVNKESITNTFEEIFNKLKV